MLREAGVRIGWGPKGVVALLKRLAKESVGRMRLPVIEKGFRRAGHKTAQGRI